VVVATGRCCCNAATAGEGVGMDDDTCCCWPMVVVVCLGPNRPFMRGLAAVTEDAPTTARCFASMDDNICG